MSDYADRWAERDQYLNMLPADERNAYVAGLAHAYADMFDAFTEAFRSATPCDVHEIFERIQAQWADVRQTVMGAL